MDNYLSSGLKNSGSTPIKRLGLSRKRRSSCLNNVDTVMCPPENLENCSEIEIKQQNFLNGKTCSKNLKVEENFENKFEKKNELEENILDPEAKYFKKIKELEDLCSIWSNGFKNALSYLIDLLQERTGQSVNVKQLLMKLRLWEVISDHFKNDPEFSLYFNDDEVSDYIN